MSNHIKEHDAVCLASDPTKVGVCIGHVIDLSGRSLYIMQVKIDEFFMGTRDKIHLINKFQDNYRETVVERVNVGGTKSRFLRVTRMYPTPEQE